jgi:small-conductance mechanosensitive channel
MEEIDKILNIEIFHYKEHSLTVFELVTIMLLFIGTKFILWVIKKALNRKTKLKDLDAGNSFALFQIIKYIIWVISIVVMLETLGIKISVLLAGSAALLVGIGLGLQQTFNDVLSGIILLFEKSVKVGDILDLDGEIVVIKEIGLRTSVAKTRAEIIIMIPNSIITTNKVINWSNQSTKTIFRVNVGVAYGSDVDLIMAILKECAKKHPEVLKKGLIDARFSDFGNSSLDFTLLFSTKNIFDVERIKSDIRVDINKSFIKNKISIPFPQMDLHLRSNNTI